MESTDCIILRMMCWYLLFMIASIGIKALTSSWWRKDGHFIDFNDEDPDDPYMMAIPYEQYMEEEWPEWMISAGKETA